MLCFFVMLDITIVGAGVNGSRMADKYKKFNNAKIRAVVSQREPKNETFLDTPFFRSAMLWRKSFGAPTKNDIFDISVHQDILISVLETFIKIGAKNFVLPKPIAQNAEDLLQIQKLVDKYKLNILVASQWHYSDLVEKIDRFVKKNKNKISSVEVVFSRSFEDSRKNSFSAATAFLPHIIQILFDTKLATGRSKIAIENFSEKKLKMRYVGKIDIKVETNIAAKEKTETLKIFLKGRDRPSLSVNFSGILGKKGFLKYPFIKIEDKELDVKEDVLEKMVDMTLKHFEGDGSSRRSLTFKKYFPVAQEEVRIIEYAKKLVVVIGGGIFGVLSALEISKKGYSVVILEKAPELVTGASLVNQCRVHMGYHYPRDEKTAINTRKAKDVFEKVFSSAIVNGVSNHYLIAKEGSMTSPEDFIVFCKKLNLPYKEAWPVGSEISKEKISLSLKVPEPIFDAYAIREILNKKIAVSSSVTLLTNAEVVGIKRDKKRFCVEYKTQGGTETVQSAAVINATYGNVNYINKLARLPLRTYQYELCEVLVVRTPWRKVGWAILDGPFFGIIPFGFSENHLFYDVEFAVLERIVNTLPKFKKNVSYYDDEKRRLRRFDEYKKKWKPYFPDVEKCEYVSSLYATRMILPKKEKTDARPTMVEELSNGFWQIFSGKITTSVPQAVELAHLVDEFFKRKK